MSTREDRLLKMVEMIRANDGATIREMTDRFGVSAVTIRKDLTRLEREGVIIRTIGGAVPLLSNDLHEAFSVRTRLQSREKCLIGMTAAGLIGSMESVIIDAGSTTLEIVGHLRGMTPLTLITPALNVALEATTLPGVTVMVPGGGILDRFTLSLEGVEVEEAFAPLHADKFFLGVRGVDLQHGLTDTDMRRIRLKQAMMKAARQVIVVADSSKFAKRSLIQIAPLAAVHTIVTDDGVAPDMLDQLTSLGLQVHVAREDPQ